MALNGVSVILEGLIATRGPRTLSLGPLIENIGPTLGRLYLPSSLFRDGCVIRMCMASLTPRSNHLGSSSKILVSSIDIL